MQHFDRGFTLIEVVASITILGIAAVSIIGLTAALTERSATAMQHQQAVIAASSYLQEALSKPLGTIPPVGGITRAFYNDIDDYNFNDNGLRDHTDTAVAGMNGFTAQINVSQVPFGAVPAAQARRVTVIVTDPSGYAVTLSAFKTFP